MASELLLNELLYDMVNQAIDDIVAGLRIGSGAKPPSFVLQQANAASWQDLLTESALNFLFQETPIIRDGIDCSLKGLCGICQCDHSRVQRAAMTVIRQQVGFIPAPPLVFTVHISSGETDMALRDANRVAEISAMTSDGLLKWSPDYKTQAGCYPSATANGGTHIGSYVATASADGLATNFQISGYERPVKGRTRKEYFLKVSVESKNGPEQSILIQGAGALYYVVSNERGKSKDLNSLSNERLGEILRSIRGGTY